MPNKSTSPSTRRPSAHRRCSARIARASAPTAARRRIRSPADPVRSSGAPGVLATRPTSRPSAATCATAPAAHLCRRGCACASARNESRKFAAAFSEHPKNLPPGAPPNPAFQCGAYVPRPRYAQFRYAEISHGMPPLCRLPPISTAIRISRRMSSNKGARSSRHEASVSSRLYRIGFTQWCRGSAASVPCRRLDLAPRRGHKRGLDGRESRVAKRMTAASSSIEA